MSRPKFSGVILLGSLLASLAILRTSAGGSESANETMMTFSPVETDSGWMVEGKLGSMTIRARELKVDSKLFSNARTYAIKDHVVITFCRKDGSSGRLQGEKISVSTR